MEFITHGKSKVGIQNRSAVINKNIIALVILKGANGLITLLMVPILLLYFTAAEYGIWMTLTSIVGWFSLFDIGLGNGLRNKLTESLAQNDLVQARVYVSTTYFVIFLISLCLCLVLGVANSLLDWQLILNTKEVTNSELSQVGLTVVIFFCIRFLANLVTIVLIADQKPAWSSLINFLGLLLSYIGLTLSLKFTEGDLLLANMILNGIPVIVLILSSFLLFHTKYVQIKPTWRSIKTKYALTLSSLGVRFFVIQITYVIVFMSSNIIITQLYGPERVTPFNVVQKYFSIPSMFFAIVLTPYWSAFTEAFHTGDLEWINKSIERLKKFFFLTVILVLLMVLMAPLAYHAWVGTKVSVGTSLTSLIAVLTILTIWNSIYASFLNGVSKIQLQLYSSLIISVVNVPLSLFFAKTLDLGIEGVVLSGCCCVAAGAIWAPIQFRRIMTNTARGIWNR